tara:strand:- start:1 stop:642 length:642 start_codon:yes stop_codon:yes gene_type:complete
MLLLILIASVFAESTCDTNINPMRARPLILNSNGELVAGPDIGGAIMHYFDGDIPWGTDVSVPIQDLYPEDMTSYADDAGGTVYTSPGPTFLPGVVGNVLVDGNNSSHVRACACPSMYNCSNENCQFSAEVTGVTVSLVCGGDCQPSDPDDNSEDDTSEDPTTPENFDSHEADEEDGGHPVDHCTISGCEEQCNNVDSDSYHEWISEVLKGKL